MEVESVLAKILDLLFNWGKKYSNKKSAKKLYYKLYEPIVAVLLPYLREYNGDENAEFMTAIKKCRKILSDNHEISNPAYIKRIDNLLNYKNTSKKRSKKANKVRKNMFNGFAHDIMLDYNKLRKIIGLGKLTYVQRTIVDQLCFDDLKSVIEFIIVISFIMLIFSVACGIIIFLENFLYS